MNNSDAYKDLPFAKPIKTIKVKSKIKLSTKPIKYKSKTSRNISRSLDDKTISEVYERDGYKCIVPECTCSELDLPHHIYYGIEANRGPDRNDVKELCTLCIDHHYIVHHGKDNSQEIRELCKDYIFNYYNNMTELKLDNVSANINSLIKSAIETKGLNTEFDTNNISDGYHTFGELYKHRVILFIALCKYLKDYEDVCDSEYSEPYSYHFIKSKKHFDGNEMKGWFIIQMETPYGQISYHLPNEYWDKCDFITTLEKANEWDGHTSDDVLERLLKLI